MPNPVVFLHGWSGDISTYGRLPELLKKKYPVIQLHLGEYTTGDDNLSIDDYAIALEKAVGANGIPRPFDVIIHSTGALVVRQWLTKFYAADAVSPIEKFIMAAPANNGSRLAGWGKKLPWDWGNKLLNALELGSRYTWELNWEWMTNSRMQRMNGLKVYHLQGGRSDLDMPGFLDKLDDLFGIDVPAFEEEGSDNTVRFCAANLNMKGVRLNPNQTIQDARPLEMKDVPVYFFKDRSHFGERHGILAAIKSEADPVFTTIDGIIGGNPSQPTPEEEYPKRLNYMMLNIRVTDQLGNPHEDFIPRFYFGSKEEKGLIDVVHKYENKEIDCYYLKYKDLASITRFGFSIEKNTIGNAIFNPSNRIDLYYPQGGINFLEERKTHFVEVAIDKTLSKEAFRLKIE